MVVVVVEGLDGVGKTRLARLLAGRVGGFYVRALDRASKHLLLSTGDPMEQAMVVYASLAPKAWVCRRSPRPCVFDRYAYSLAYQIARGLDPAIALRIMRRLPRPDTVVYITGGTSEVPGADAREVARWMRALLEAWPPRHLIVINTNDAVSIANARR